MERAGQGISSFSFLFQVPSFTNIGRLSHKVIARQLAHYIVHQLTHYKPLWDSLIVHQLAHYNSSYSAPTNALYFEL